LLRLAALAMGVFAVACAMAGVAQANPVGPDGREAELVRPIRIKGKRVDRAERVRVLRQSEDRRSVLVASADGLKGWTAADNLTSIAEVAPPPTKSRSFQHGWPFKLSGSMSAELAYPIEGSVDFSEPRYRVSLSGGVYKTWGIFGVSARTRFRYHRQETDRQSLGFYLGARIKPVKWLRLTGSVGYGFSTSTDIGAEERNVEISSGPGAAFVASVRPFRFLQLTNSTVYLQRMRFDMEGASDGHTLYNVTRLTVRMFRLFDEINGNLFTQAYVSDSGRWTYRVGTALRVAF
jgi:hypothetical protein